MKTIIPNPCIMAAVTWGMMEEIHRVLLTYTVPLFLNVLELYTLFTTYSMDEIMKFPPKQPSGLRLQSSQSLSQGCKPTLFGKLLGKGVD